MTKESSAGGKYNPNIPMAGKKVLVIDDDAELGEMLREYLKRFEFEVVFHSDPLAGLAASRSNEHDAIVLDVMMPKIDGIEACQRIREFSSVPVMMLTARGDTSDKVLGLGVGADDYLAKPFDPRELAARLDALIRRHRRMLTQAQVGDIEVSARAGKAYRVNDGNKQDLGLTDTEFAALNLLIKHRPDPVSRDDLFELMRGFQRDLSDRSTDILISRLRAKLGDDHHSPRYIRTVRLVGYAYIA